jgi:hypothetical protein
MAERARDGKNRLRDVGGDSMSHVRESEGRRTKENGLVRSNRTNLGPIGPFGLLVDPRAFLYIAIT